MCIRDIAGTIAAKALRRVEVTGIVKVGHFRLAEGFHVAKAEAWLAYVHRRRAGMAGSQIPPMLRARSGFPSIPVFGGSRR